MCYYNFPKDFVWGTATASYQIEGAADEDGRGLSIWDTFCNIPGKVKNNDSGKNACNHYHLYKNDIQLMKEIGLKAYRFSISWPRIFPEGEGNHNLKGIDFYNKLIDGLLEAEITPYVTLFHWDLPQNLEDKYGGWRSKEVSKLFGDYSAFIAEKFSDRVENWFTINEIRGFTSHSFRLGRHAPGKIEPEKVVNQTIHNALLGHGLAVNAIRAHAKLKPNIGIVENFDTTWPVIDTEENIIAAKTAWKHLNDFILFPLFRGKYDEIYLSRVGGDVPAYTDVEMKIISTPCDFIGYNYYAGAPVRARIFPKESSDKLKMNGIEIDDSTYEILEYSEDFPRTYLKWPITPKSLYYALKWSKEEFGDIPIYITENGMAGEDKETENREVIDLSRIEYIREHLEMLHKAIQAGCNIKGYFLWSLMDNFEWSHGYSQRFGIFKVNYSTFERYLKYSGEYYKNIIKENSLGY
ncbi:MAG TPA: GH1 family beta-glucosidase [Victivallales bacterium]|nr:GH1 family beta-glucosidase [Victivallales bacterium]